jgi:hypothetical protein
MKILAVLNPENGTCKETLSLLYNLQKEGNEILKVLLVLENTYHSEKWVISLSMPLSKEEIERIKEKYTNKVLSEWEALSGNTDLPVVAEVNEAKKVLEEKDLSKADFLVLGCLESKSLCKLIETLDKPILVVKN